MLRAPGRRHMQKTEVISLNCQIKVNKLRITLRIDRDRASHSGLPGGESGTDSLAPEAALVLLLQGHQFILLT